MPRTTHLLLAALSAVLISNADAFAQSDRGKRRLPKLFATAVQKASQSTVRVKADGKDVALGTIVSSDGYIMTKGSELRGEVSIVLADGSAYDAVYAGYHKATDIALLKVDATGLKAVKFADAKEAEVGNWVAVASCGDDALAVGVISAGARKLYGPEAFIENLNKGYLGIRLTDPKEGESGVVIAGLEPGAAAAKAGLKAKDIIVEVAGKSVKDRETLLTLLEGYRPNDKVKVRFKRGEEEESREVEVKLGFRSEFDRSTMQNAMGGALSGRRTGFPQVIMHDTVIRPTDCGGPLVDLDGKVLGINIARAGRVETWTLPSEVLSPLLKEMRAGTFPPPPIKISSKK